VIFFRDRGRAGRTRAERRGAGPRHAAGRRRVREEPDARDDASFDEGGHNEGERPVAQGRGPYDVDEAPPEVPGLDLGSLRIPAVDGVEVRVQAGPNGDVQQLALVSGASALQLDVFAAPRSEGIWEEVRAELTQSLLAAGASVEEVAGEYGVELRASLRGPEGTQELRYLGIDGPRWMVRAIYHGRAAVDPAAAGPLAECLAGLVVDRGRQAMPVGERLPLRLPREMVQGRAPEAAAAPATPFAGNPAEGTPERGGPPGRQAPRGGRGA
jgi:hypothetical protein